MQSRRLVHDISEKARLISMNTEKRAKALPRARRAGRDSSLSGSVPASSQFYLSILPAEGIYHGALPAQPEMLSRVADPEPKNPAPVQANERLRALRVGALGNHGSLTIFATLSLYVFDVWDD
jgi:hypothetical protein